MSSKIAAVFAQLPAGAPFFAPKHVAPLLGVTPNAFTHHCRDALKNWEGHYRFHTDDQGDLKALERVINRVLWVGRKLPKNL